MPNTNIVLPFLSALPKQAAFVDPNTGMLSADALRWIIEVERTIFGLWKDVPYAAANFNTSNPAITWTVAAGSVIQLAYFQMGQYATVLFYLTGGVVSVDVPTLEITIPTLQVSATAPGKFPNACVVTDGATPAELGLTYLLGSASSQAIVAIQKASNANFAAASAAIQCLGCVTFMCQSFVTP